MLQLKIDKTQLFNEATQEFLYVKEQTLTLEHSLVSIAKWESKWCKPFLTKDPKTTEETIDYIRCMTITQNVDPNVYFCITPDQIEMVGKYIDAPMTATKLPKDRSGKRNREQITNELIYYWMVANNIPSKYEKWHLNRLLTLIQVCNIKSQPPKKMSKRELMSRNAALNAQRRKQFNTKG